MTNLLDPTSVLMVIFDDILRHFYLLTEPTETFFREAQPSPDLILESILHAKNRHIFKQILDFSRL
jgi:hypothetical protein